MSFKLPTDTTATIIVGCIFGRSIVSQKNQNNIFEKVLQLCCYVTHGERRHSLLLCDYCSHIDPNWTQKDKEKEGRQQIWA